MTHASRSAGLPGHALAPIHPLHPRRWTPLRIAAFLTMLDATGLVAAAVQAAGMSRQSAYRLRAPSRFRRGVEPVTFVSIRRAKYHLTC